MQKQFIDAFKDALEIEDFTPKMEDEFKDYEEWDSLARLSVIAMLDEEYNMQIEDADFQKINTVEELFKTIKQHSNN